MRDRTTGAGRRAATLRQDLVDRRMTLQGYTRATGEHHPAVAEWRWGAGRPADI